VRYYYVQLDEFSIVKAALDTSAPIDKPNMIQTDAYRDDLFGWKYENGIFIPVPPPPTWVITKVAMISRFTPQEYVGIVGATKTDVEVQAWYDLFQAATQINLQDQRTIAGIESMVPKNLLTQARATEILTTPAQPNEIP
jgi:hypothetical protein